MQLTSRQEAEQISAQQLSEPPARERWLLAHDYAFAFGGAERCTAVIASDLLPDCDAYLLAGSLSVASAIYGSRRVRSALPLSMVPERLARMCVVLMYPLIRSLPPFDGNVLSSTYAIAHLRRARGVKVVYCHSPFRQLYSGVADYFPVARGPHAGRLLRALLFPFRVLDRAAARESDAVIAPNQLVAERVRRYWGIEPTAIIAPPIETQVFVPLASPTRGYYLWVGRIVEPYKRLSIVLAAFADRPDDRLIVVGEGRDRRRLEKKAPPNVEFAGVQQGSALADLMGNARALIFPSADDFGMVPVEAMAAGTPVIAFAGGGAGETVRDGLTGILFHEQTPASLANAMDRSSDTDWDYPAIRRHAAGFNREVFVRRMSAVLAAVRGK